MFCFSCHKHIKSPSGVRFALAYCAFHVLVQPNIWRYYFYFLPAQTQTHLDHCNVVENLGISENSVALGHETGNKCLL